MNHDDRELLRTEPIQPDFPGITVKEAAENLQRFAEALNQKEPSTYLDHLDAVGKADADSLRRAEKSYGDSWKRRGGVGAFMMLARKWDRLENAMTSQASRFIGADGRPMPEAPQLDRYDIFNRAKADKRAEGIIDDIRDLRRYLMLVEAHLIAEGEGRDEVKK